MSATVDEETYRALHNEHRLIADVVCFPGCHINHLTPRTLDIDRVQSMMPECGIEPKILIEGPPRREVPILLRQTSFKALEETVLFAGQKQGTHTARFGEIEQRGVALTPKGRQLYDDLLRNAGTGQDNLTHQMHLQETFRTFPDSEFLMRQQGLAWLSLIHISEPTRQAEISYAVFCLKKKKNQKEKKKTTKKKQQKITAKPPTHLSTQKPT